MSASCLPSALLALLELFISYLQVKHKKRKHDTADTSSQIQQIGNGRDDDVLKDAFFWLLRCMLLHIDRIQTLVWKLMCNAKGHMSHDYILTITWHAFSWLQTLTFCVHCLHFTGREKNWTCCHSSAAAWQAGLRLYCIFCIVYLLRHSMSKCVHYSAVR